MKQIKITLIVLLTLFTTTLFAQKTEEKTEKEEQPKHEVGLDFLDLVGLKKFEFSYNYLLNESESIGTDISFSPDNEDFAENQGFQDNFSINLNYKHYFSKKYAQGFYVEALTRYSKGKAFLWDSQNSNYLFDNSKKFNSLEAGFGLGYKFVSKRNFFIDANINISRNLNNSLKSNNDYNLPKAISNLGIRIGKRF